MASWGLWLPLDREPCFPDRKAGPRRPVWPANPCDMTWGTPGAEAAATRAARPVDRDGTSSITCTCVARRQSEEARRRSIGVRPLPGPGEKQQDVPRVQPLPRLDRSLPPEPKLVSARHERRSWCRRLRGRGGRPRREGDGVAPGDAGAVDTGGVVGLGLAPLGGAAGGTGGESLGLAWSVIGGAGGIWRSGGGVGTCAMRVSGSPRGCGADSSGGAVLVAGVLAGESSSGPTAAAVAGLAQSRPHRIQESLPTGRPAARRSIRAGNGCRHRSFHPGLRSVLVRD